MSATRLIAPVLPHRPRPFWLAPLCTLIVASPFALAAGMAAAWMTNPDPTVSVAQPEPVFSPPPLVLVTTEPAAPSSTYREPSTAEPTVTPPRTVTRWRTADPVAPPPTVTRTPAPTTTATTSTPTTTGEPSVSTTPDETSAGADTPSPGGTQ